jgi:hypothetical protein
MPYLAMMDRLRAFFAKPKAILVTCGFSFGDQHLNEAFDQGLRGNPTAQTFALLYNGIESYPQAKQLASTRPNLSLLARDGAILGTRQYTWARSDTEPAVDAAAASAAKGSPEFPLGDFATFGDFVRDIIGERQHE